MKKQSAVSFLREAMSIHLTEEQKQSFEGLWQQALDMEHEQIVKAAIWEPFLGNYAKNVGKEYYEEIYGTK